MNCCGREISSNWSSMGIIYFTLNWRDTNTQIIFGGKTQNLLKSLRFIDTALQKGDCVLVHSVNGKNRACCVILSYLIYKYNWTLNKSLEFLESLLPDMNIKANFLKQLYNLEKSINRTYILTDEWTSII